MSAWAKVKARVDDERAIDKPVAVDVAPSAAAPKDLGPRVKKSRAQRLREREKEAWGMSEEERKKQTPSTPSATAWESFASALTCHEAAVLFIRAAGSAAISPAALERSRVVDKLPASCGSLSLSSILWLVKATSVAVAVRVAGPRLRCVRRHQQ